MLADYELGAFYPLLLSIDTFKLIWLLGQKAPRVQERIRGIAINQDHQNENELESAKTTKFRSRVDR